MSRGRLVGAAALGLLLLVAGGSGVVTGSPGTAVLAGFMAAVGLVLLAGAVAELRWQARRPVVVATSTTDGERSTYVPFAPGSVGVPAGALVAAVLAGLAGLVVAWDAGSTGGLTIGAVVAVGGLAWLAPWLAGRVRPGGVHLTPTRVVHEHLGTRWEVAWDDVRGVVPREPVAVVVAGLDRVRRERAAAYAWSGDVRTQDSGVVGIATRHLGLDAASLGHVMAVCQATPDLRTRLGDPATTDLRVFGRGD